MALGARLARAGTDSWRRGRSGCSPRDFLTPDDPCLSTLDAVIFRSALHGQPVGAGSNGGYVAALLIGMVLGVAAEEAARVGATVLPSRCRQRSRRRSEERRVGKRCRGARWQ